MDTKSPRAGPYGLTSMAGGRFAKKAVPVHQDKLVDATPEFCSRIFGDDNEDNGSWNRNLTPDGIKKRLHRERLRCPAITKSRLAEHKIAVIGGTCRLRGSYSHIMKMLARVCLVLIPSLHILRTITSPGVA